MCTCNSVRLLDLLAIAARPSNEQPCGMLQGPVLEYDIIGHPQADFHFAVVFPFHSADGGSVTLIREYAQVRGLDNREDSSAKGVTGRLPMLCV